MRHLVEKFRDAIASRRAAKATAPVESIPLQPEFFAAGDDPAAEADRLYQELLSLYSAGAIERAVDVAHRLAEIRREQFGARHPEYASALGHHALLLQNLGNLKEAEAGLRAVLEIRREALGRHNPLLAMTLSQLAMLLVETGQWNAAEAALVESVSIRSLLLGESHPSVASDLKMLEMLARRRRESVRPPATTLIPSAPASLVAESKPSGKAGELLLTTGKNPLRDAATIRDEICALAGSLTRVGAGMTAGGQRMMTQGVPPDSRLLFDATDLQRRFASLCDEAARRAEALDLDRSRFLPFGRDQFSLPDLTMLFEEIVRLESTVVDAEKTRGTALALIARVLTLTHADRSETDALRPVLALAESLQTEVKGASAGRSSAEVLAIADGSHPLSALERLADEGGVELDDEAWTRHYETVAASQGKRLAAAAARGRLKLRKIAPLPSSGATPFDGLSSSRSVTDLTDSVLDAEDVIPGRVRGSVLDRIVIPDGTAAAARKPNRFVKAPAPAPTPIETTPPVAEPVRPARRPAAKDDYAFLQTQTSFIGQ